MKSSHGSGKMSGRSSAFVPICLRDELMTQGIRQQEVWASVILTGKS